MANSTAVHPTLWRLVSILILKTATAQVQQNLYLQTELQFIHQPVIQTLRPVTCAHLSLLQDQNFLNCNGLQGNGCTVWFAVLYRIKQLRCYHQVQGGFGGPLGRHLLPQSPPNVAHGGSSQLELSWKLDLPVVVDGPLAGVLQGCEEDTQGPQIQRQALCCGLQKCNAFVPEVWNINPCRNVRLTMNI